MIRPCRVADGKCASAKSRSRSDRWLVCPLWFARRFPKGRVAKRPDLGTGTTRPVVEELGQSAFGELSRPGVSPGTIVRGNGTGGSFGTAKPSGCDDCKT